MVQKILARKTEIIKIAVLIAISFLYLSRSFKSFQEPYIKGDGVEYVLMTQAFSSHFSPNVNVEDIDKLKDLYLKNGKWNELNARQSLETFHEELENSKGEYKELRSNFYCNKNKKWICQHFFFYSLINLPAFLIFKKADPLLGFYFTNALFVIIACFIILFFAPFSFFNQVFAALCFAFSCCYWYLGWQHTEVYTTCLVAISLIALFRKNYYLAMLLLALACLQNQPLMVLFGLYALITLIGNGINIKNIIKIGAIGILAIIPPVYYYLNFETTNLIKDAGFLDTKYITVNRVSGFYTDLSQGMILTIPLILIAYLILWLNEALKVVKKENKFDLTLFIPFVVLFISITVATMGNWNHGMAIINRYATWLSIIIMIHAFYLANKLQNIQAGILFVLFFITQFITTRYHQQFNKFDWSSGHFTPVAKWCLNNHEKFYSPDPVIFAGRIAPAVALIEENSPIIYFYKKEVKKVLVHRKKINDLEKFGISQGNIKHINEHIKYNYDWGYINLEDFKTTLTGEQIYKLLRQRKLDAVYNQIKSSVPWMEDIEKKAKEKGITVEEACWIDADYIVSLEEKSE